MLYIEDTHLLGVFVKPLLHFNQLFDHAMIVEIIL